MRSVANRAIQYFAAASFFAFIIAPAYAAETEGQDAAPIDKATMEAAVRLQIFLDRSEFAPGKIDGRYGQFTVKALALYRESRGETSAPPPEKPDTAPDVSGIDLPGITREIKAGDTLSVPNVEPFDLASVKELTPGGEPAANDVEDDGKQEGETTKTAVKIDTRISMLTVHVDGKLIAAYPVTIGSEQTGSPVGNWKIRGVAKMPNFRYDK